MGCLLAGLIGKTRRVVLLCRNADGAKALAKAGVRLSGPGDTPERTIAVEAVTDVSEVSPPPGLVFLCVKARDTEGAVAPLVGTSLDATVAVVQNGLGRAAIVGKLLGDPERVVGVFTSEGSTRLAPRFVRHSGPGETCVGALAGGLARAEQVADVLAAAGLKVRLEADLRQIEWEKVQVNAAINALSGLLGCPNGALLESDFSQALGDCAAIEVGVVAKALGIPGDWSEEAGKGRWRAVARATAGNRSSTLEDLLRGQKTEVFAINGAVAQAANELGVNTCVNRVLAQLLGAREEL
jgi:2-dehydropantoate 2-reductase